jgi:cation:H+ antiporter
MLQNILVLVGSVVLIFIAAYLFVNVIEWLGERWKLGGSFVGSILAPLFTSFPEMIIFLVAVFSFGGNSGEEVGLGTLFGQPFMASSVAYGLVGIAAIVGFAVKKRKSRTLTVDRSLVIPYIFITVLFPLTVVPSFFHAEAVKYIFGVIFLGAFLYYILLMYRRRTAESIEDTETPYFSRLAGKSESRQVAAAALQLLIAIGMLYFGSERIVGAINHISESANISALGLSLIIIPLATAIPETISAIIWSYHGKDTLGMGALVGEKILYSTFYPGLGLFVTSWTLDKHAYISVGATFVVSLVLLFFILRRKIPTAALLFGLLFFIGYAVAIFAFQF